MLTPRPASGGVKNESIPAVAVVAFLPSWSTYAAGEEQAKSKKPGIMTCRHTIRARNIFEDKSTFDTIDWSGLVKLVVRKTSHRPLVCKLNGCGGWI